MKNNQLQLVTFEQAKRLKAAGFDWPVYHYFQVSADEAVARYKNDFDFDVNGKHRDGRISAPTVALALKWIRDVKGECGYILIDVFTPKNGKPTILFSANTLANGFVSDSDAYEPAESALLDELLMIFDK